jgi:RluA family pseudouridine synthase
MPFHTWRHAVARHEDGWRLDAVLADHLPRALDRDLSRAAIRRLLVGGAVRVNGITERRPGVRILSGSSVSARVDLDRLTPRAEPPSAHLSRLDVLYEDEDLIAITKPAGISTHASADPRRPDVVSIVRRMLASSASGGEPYVGVHQRLDRETSGVVLFTKSARANGPLARAFAGHAVVKVYHALVVPSPRRPRRAWTIDVPLAVTGSGAASRMASSPGGLPSRTDVRLVEQRPHAWLVEARPQTGRRHQVRAHLADAGLPVLGDTRYGAPGDGPSRAARVMLHCARLELRHPITEAPLVLACDWPDDFRAALLGRSTT